MLSKVSLSWNRQAVKARATRCNNAVVVRCERCSALDVSDQDAKEYVSRNGADQVFVKLNLGPINSNDADVLKIPVKHTAIIGGKLKVTIRGMAARDLKRCPKESIQLNDGTKSTVDAFRIELLFGDHISLPYLAIVRPRKSNKSLGSPA